MIYFFFPYFITLAIIIKISFLFYSISQQSVNKKKTLHIKKTQKTIFIQQSNKMDRDMQLGNRVIANYMQQKQKKRLKQRIKFIKHNKSQYSQQGFIKNKPRTNSLFFQSNFFENKKENQQIEKQNVALFNRIASIIKKTPKLSTQQSSGSLQKSRQTTTLWHRKIQSSLDQQNKIIQKRLFNQKPTINNKSFYQQRARHLQYLKNISKYPYILNKNIKTQPDNNILDEININMTQLPPILNGNESKSRLNANGQVQSSSLRELFKHSSLDFTITVYMDLKQDVCTFVIQNNQIHQQKYSLTIPKIQFVAYFEQSEYDYEKMVSNLRLNDDGKIVYAQQTQNRKNQTPKEEKQTFKNRAQSTAYTSTGFKYGFRTSKRNITQKSEKKEKDTCKTDRKPNVLKSQLKNDLKKQPDTMSQNKFNQVKLFQKNN